MPSDSSMGFSEAAGLAGHPNGVPDSLLQAVQSLSDSWLENLGTELSANSTGVGSGVSASTLIMVSRKERGFLKHFKSHIYKLLCV